MTKSSKKNKNKPRLNEELDGFNITINSFGEIKTSVDISNINDFLNKNVDDKKLAEREDWEEITGKSDDDKVLRKKTVRKKS